MIRIYIRYVVFILLLWGCSSSGQDEVFPEVPDEEEEIVYREILPVCSVYTPEVEVTTRAGEGVKDPNSTITARIFRADDTGSWPVASSTLDNQTATVNGGTQAVTLSPPWYYLTNGKGTKLLGIYPSAYTSMSSNEVIYPVDGYTDIMATPWSNAANKTSTVQPALTFKHMLSQLIITIKGEDATAVSLWGKVTKVTVNGVSTSCKVTLTTSGETTDPTVAVNGTGTADFQVRKKDGTVHTVDVPITTSADVYGYCMIVPFTISATKPLNLTVYTEKAPNGQSVSLTTTTAMASGKAYTIQLNMTKKAIVPTATIASWGSSQATIEGEP